jgi:hypothetical protein
MTTAALRDIIKETPCTTRMLIRTVKLKFKGKRQMGQLRTNGRGRC